MEMLAESGDMLCAVVDETMLATVELSTCAGGGSGERLVVELSG